MVFKWKLHHGRYLSFLNLISVENKHPHISYMLSLSKACMTPLFWISCQWQWAWRHFLWPWNSLAIFLSDDFVQLMNPVNILFSLLKISFLLHLINYYLKVNVREHWPEYSNPIYFWQHFSFLISIKIVHFFRWKTKTFITAIMKPWEATYSFSILRFIIGVCH